MRILPSIILTLVCWLLSCSSPALAGAMQSSRSQTAVTVGQNTIIADSSVKYVGYLAGDTITVTLAYSASCNIVFQDLAAFDKYLASPRRQKFVNEHQANWKQVRAFDSLVPR